MRARLIFSLVWNDLKRNKAINGAIFLIIFVSALLMASGTLVIERLLGALDHTYEIAKPPHYLQMHIGEIDREAVEAFSTESGKVKKMQVQEMVNVEGVNISVKHLSGTRSDFSDSILDHYFVVQNSVFDFLLDTENQIVELSPGEVGIPVLFSKTKKIGIGDDVRIHLNNEEKTFKVTHLIRDAQMGSSLASSIRFLVHEEDFKWLSDNSNRHESIISFLLNEEKEINAFEGLYNTENSNMPKNGIGITLPLIHMVNGIGDGLMSAMIVLVSLVLIAIALANIRFTVLSTLEDDARSIGALKAIGLSSKDIHSLYKAKYRTLTMIACVLALFFSFMTSNLLVSNIQLNFGVSAISTATLVTPIVSVVVIYIVVDVFLSRLMKIVSRMTVLDALILGEIVDSKKKKHSMNHPLKWIFNHLGVSMSAHAMKKNLKSWGMLTLVFFTVVFTILTPLNLLMTMKSPDFIKYVGAAKSDLRIAFEKDNELQNSLKRLEDQLITSNVVKEWHVFKSTKAMLNTEKGPMTFVVESGQYDSFSVEMDEGRLPSEPGEIALSALNANRLERQLGDVLELDFSGKSGQYTVVGVYQDITSGGLTAKICEDLNDDYTQVVYFINLNEGASLNEFTEKYAEQFNNAKVIGTHTLMKQTLGTIIDSLQAAVFLIFLLSLFIIALLSVLFMTLKIYKCSADDAVLLALGFRVNDIRFSYLTQSAVSIVLGVFGGALASYYLGSQFMRLSLSIMSFGLTKMSFLIHWPSFILLGMFTPIAVGLLMVWRVTGNVWQTTIMNYGNE